MFSGGCGTESDPGGGASRPSSHSQRCVPETRQEVGPPAVRTSMISRTCIARSDPESEALDPESEALGWLARPTADHREPTQPRLEW